MLVAGSGLRKPNRTALNRRDADLHQLRRELDDHLVLAGAQRLAGAYLVAAEAEVAPARLVVVPVVDHLCAVDRTGG